MLAKTIDELPAEMRNEYTKNALCALNRKRGYFALKRAVDFAAALSAVITLQPLFIGTAAAVFFTSRGDIIFRQKRIKQNMEEFYIYKFRTMYPHSGTALAKAGDSRITKVGSILRRYRLDELPQLFNILKGDMSFVGPRPELEKYVRLYSSRDLTALLVPCGLTSKASIAFRKEDALLAESKNPENMYQNFILPLKNRLNLDYVNTCGLKKDFEIIAKTVFALMGGEKVCRGTVKIIENVVCLKVD